MINAASNTTSAINAKSPPMEAPAMDASEDDDDPDMQIEDEFAPIAWSLAAPYSHTRHVACPAESE